jgi:HAD superfamily hydrolase (TIGR01509 family)
LPSLASAPVTPDLVIFDCDGVLVDSEAIVIEIEAELLTEAGFPMSADECADKCVGLSGTDVGRMLEAEFGRPLPDDLYPRIERGALARFRDDLRPVTGMPELLTALDLPRCVASSSDLDRIKLSLDLTGLTRHFDPAAIYSAQMVTRGKPAPDLFLHAAGLLGATPDRCLVIEDSPAGVAAALAADMSVVGFTAGTHARPSLEQRLRAAGASTIFERADELQGLLEG